MVDRDLTVNNNIVYIPMTGRAALSDIHITDRVVLAHRIGTDQQEQVVDVAQVNITNLKCSPSTYVINENSLTLSHESSPA